MRKRTLRTGIALMSVLFLAGCVTFDSGGNSGSEKSEVFPSGMQTSTSIIDELTPERKPDCQTFAVSYDKTWAATLKVLKTLDNAITTTDRESGVIATDYMERPVTMFTDTWRDKYYVTLNKINASSTEVRIKRTVEKLEAVEIVRGSRIAGKVWREKTGDTIWKRKQSNGAYEKYILGLIEKEFETK